MTNVLSFSEADKALLHTNPATQESIGRAARLGYELGTSYTNEPELFDANLRVTLTGALTRELRSVPTETSQVFVKTAFAARREYEEAKRDIAQREEVK